MHFVKINAIIDILAHSFSLYFLGFYCITGPFIMRALKSFPVYRFKSSKLFTTFARTKNLRFPDFYDDSVAPPKVDNVKETLKMLDSGDILLYDWPVSWAYARALLDVTAWDHISIIVRQRGTRSNLVPPEPAIPKNSSVPNGFKWKPFEDGQLQIFEANATGCWAYPLDQFFELSEGKYKHIAFRALLDENGARKSLDDEQKDNLEMFVREVWGRPYEPHLFAELLKAVVNQPCVESVVDKSEENLEGLFCSELVAEAYQRAGLIPECVLNSNEVMPSAFAGPRHIDAPGIVDKLMEKKGHGFRLGYEQLIQWPGSPKLY